MMVQAGTFMLPKKIWSALEGGLMEEFGTDAKTAVILEEEFEEAVVIGERDSMSKDQLTFKFVNTS